MKGKSICVGPCQSVRAIHALVLAAFLWLAGGCGDGGQGKRKDPVNELEQKLASVALSQELTLDLDVIKKCDDQRVAKILEAPVVQQSDRAAVLWEDCQSLYACSPIARKLMSSLFESNATFKIGFADLRQAEVSRIGDKVAALYLSGTSQVYLDKSLKKNATACPLLLHELVHRFDVMAASGVESLDVEYRAYWYQEAFLQELAREQNGKPSRSRSSMITSEALLRKVAVLYGFSVDLSILDRFDPLPVEL